MTRDRRHTSGDEPTAKDLDKRLSKVETRVNILLALAAAGLIGGPVGKLVAAAIGGPVGQAIANTLGAG